MATSNKAIWVRQAWDGGIGREYDDVMVGVDGDKVIIHRLHNPSERVVFSRQDWAKLFWAVKHQIERMGEDGSEDADAARQKSLRHLPGICV